MRLGAGSMLRGAVVRAVVARGVAFAVLWGILTEGAGGPRLAAVLIPLAVGATFVLVPPRGPRVRPLEVLRFVPFFLWISLRGGIDVARRALAPRMRLAPALVDYSLRVTSERERVLLAYFLSLVPGTVSVDLEADRLRLHVLDAALPIAHTVRRIERRVAALFYSPAGAG